MISTRRQGDDPGDTLLADLAVYGGRKVTERDLVRSAMLGSATHEVFRLVKRGAAVARCSRKNLKDGTSAERDLPRRFTGWGAIFATCHLWRFAVPRCLIASRDGKTPKVAIHGQRAAKKVALQSKSQRWPCHRWLGMIEIVGPTRR
jgi:hypothetical protein